MALYENLIQLESYVYHGVAVKDVSVILVLAIAATIGFLYTIQEPKPDLSHLPLLAPELGSRRERRAMYLKDAPGTQLRGYTDVRNHSRPHRETCRPTWLTFLSLTKSHSYLRTTKVGIYSHPSSRTLMAPKVQEYSSALNMWKRSGGFLTSFLMNKDKPKLLVGTPLSSLPLEPINLTDARDFRQNTRVFGFLITLS